MSDGMRRLHHQNVGRRILGNEPNEFFRACSRVSVGPYMSVAAPHRATRHRSSLLRKYHLLRVYAQISKHEHGYPILLVISKSRVSQDSTPRFDTHRGSWTFRFLSTFSLASAPVNEEAPDSSEPQQEGWRSTFDPLETTGCIGGRGAFDEF